jgi:nucleoside-diphosphate-sugar epimerase
MAAELVAVTGASGFLGRFLVPELLQRGFRVRASVRNATAQFPVGVEYVSGDLADPANVDNLVIGADVVVHLAGRAHRPSRTVSQRRELFDVNFGITSQLARAAAKSGVRRLVFASTIGVLGSCSPQGHWLTDATKPSPDGDYGRSKLAAEHELQALSRHSSLEVTIVRPTLVFGPGAPGNVERLVRLVASGVPLPFGKLDGLRSFIGVRNLADLFCICCTHPLAGGEVFVAADHETLTVPAIVQIIGRGLQRHPRVWRVPPSLLAAAAGLLGKSGDFARISAPLMVDASRAHTLLDWHSAQSLSDAILETAAGFLVDNVR